MPGISTNKTFSVKIPLTPAFKDEQVNMQPTEIDLSFELNDGEHVVVTDFIDVGEINNRTIQARISIHYEYIPGDNYLKVCSHDFISDKATLLTTAPGDNALAYHHSSNPVNEEAKNTSTNWIAELDSPNALHDALRNSLKLATQIIIDKATNEDYIVLLRKPVPPMDEEMARNLQLVYYKGSFAEFFDPDKTYGEGYKIQSIFSTFGGTSFFKVNQNFANIIGSTHDPKIPGNSSWVGLWEYYFGAAQYCATYNYFSNENNVCYGGLVGGHSVTGTVAKPVGSGSDGVAFIIPICRRHNAKNDGYHKFKKYTGVVWLNDYDQ